MLTRDTARTLLAKHFDGKAIFNSDLIVDALIEASTMTGLTPAAVAVLNERHRQVVVEGFATSCDDGLIKGELAAMSACYALSARSTFLAGPAKGGAPGTLWPAPAHVWKAKTPREDLVRAGALILAEIERLDRAAGPKAVMGQALTCIPDGQPLNFNWNKRTPFCWYMPTPDGCIATVVYGADEPKYEPHHDPASAWQPLYAD